MLERLSFYAQVWWIYLLFGLLQFALGEGLDCGYGRIRDWLDRRHPDDLPLPADEWLVYRIRESAWGLSFDRRPTLTPLVILQSGVKIRFSLRPPGSVLHA